MSVATASRGMRMRALAALGRCMRAPFRALVRARDVYVSRMAACAGGPVGLVAVPRSQSHVFYRSAADDVDVRELIRAGEPKPPLGVGPRSQSVAIWRIDEDRPCEFGLEDGALGPRSRSFTVGPSARTTARTRRVVVGA